MKYCSPLLMVIFCFFCPAAYAQTAHPHILVKSSDKAMILQKLQQQAWAKQSFEEMMQAVTVYVERHAKDPEWILSRYLLNRAPGKRYTRFYSDADGTELVKYEGDAPFPTVRVSPHKRPPITKDGYGYRMPSIEELVPYDTAMTMLLTSEAPGAKKERVNPQSFVEGINRKINELALDAAIIYWLTGKEAYAVFAADILTQWARGAYYQQPIEGPCRTGFLSIQTLGDGNYNAMPLVYDFLYDFLRQKKYETSWYETVFTKIAATMTFRGFWNNNWFAAQTPAMVYAALSLEDKQQTDYFLQFYMTKDTVNAECGHLALPSVIDKWLTPDGHWKEPGGYHNFPISSLLSSALAMENNGYNVFGKYPALLQSSYVLLKYSFPNFSAPSIGDTGPVSQSPECLEMGILMAKKYHDPAADQLVAAMNVLVQQKGYKRKTAGWMGLLCFLPEIPAANGEVYMWPRSGALEFARCYLQRNGTDQQHGLMYLVQGASYNHNHANGMSLELYGAGHVMGIDPGKGLTYEAPMHVNYYAQWAAHNTVVAGAASGAVPYFKGGGGTKKMGAIQLQAMEPLAGDKPVSAYCSFTDTRYTDISTATKQQRTLAIVRTSDTTGYYFDVFRSDNARSNEYLYHNIGDSLELLDAARIPLTVSAAELPISQQPFDPPGLRNIAATMSPAGHHGNTTALFTLTEKNNSKAYMQVLFTAETQRMFYTGKGPASGTADIPYRSKPTPVLISRQEGEAWARPFVAVYEPFTGAENYSVEKLVAEDTAFKADFSAVRVYNKNQSQQLLLQSVAGSRTYMRNDWFFKGRFGIVSLMKNKLQYLYLGEGTHIGYGNYSISTSAGVGAASLELTEKGMIVSCNQAITISVGDKKIKTVTLINGQQKINVAVNTTTSGAWFTVNAVSNGIIEINN